MKGGTTVSKRGSGSSVRAGGGNFSAEQMNLSGSEKQVAWAKDIVKQAFQNLDSQIKQRQKMLNDDIEKTAKRAGKTKTEIRKVNFANPNSTPSLEKLWIDTAKEYKANSIENFKKMPAGYPASRIIDARYGLSAESMIRAIDTMVTRKQNKNRR